MILPRGSRQTTRRRREGGAPWGSGRLCRATGVGEGLCWRRGGLGAAREPLGGVGRATDIRAGLWVSASPAAARGIKRLLGPRGLPRGMRGGGLGRGRAAPVAPLASHRGAGCGIPHPCSGNADGGA